MRELSLSLVSDFAQNPEGKASGVVSNMLAFLRRSASQLTPNRPDDMLEIVVRLAGSDYDLEMKYDLGQIETVRDSDPERGEVHFHRTQIEQVLLDLVNEAAHAMANTQILPPRRIRLGSWRERGRACIEAKHDGPGIERSAHKGAREPYFASKDGGVGTGLGLSVWYFVAGGLQNGSIGAASRQGEGCRPTIRLPIAGMEAA